MELTISVYGAALGVLVIGALYLGALSVELHGFMIATFAQSLWFIGAAIVLWRATYDLPLSQTSSG